MFPALGPSVTTTCDLRWAHRSLCGRDQYRPDQVTVGRKRIGDLRPRHTLSGTGSTAVSFGESLKMAGAFLGHSTAAATEVYAHLQHNLSKIAADRVSGTISAALNGNPTAQIVSLRRA
jgi:hypothetical protein